MACRNGDGTEERASCKTVKRKQKRVRSGEEVKAVTSGCDGGGLKEVNVFGIVR